MDAGFNQSQTKIKINGCRIETNQNRVQHQWMPDSIKSKINLSVIFTRPEAEPSALPALGRKAGAFTVAAGPMVSSQKRDIFQVPYQGSSRAAACFFLFSLMPIGCGSNLNDRRGKPQGLKSMFPLTRVTHFGIPFFEPQPCGKLRTHVQNKIYPPSMEADNFPFE